MPIKFLFFFCITLFFSCKKNTNSEQKIQPKEIYSKQGVIIKAYDFDSFEKFLKLKNDSTYVINFWATWCQPCVEELPNFEKIGLKFKNDKLKVILVSLDMKKQIQSSLLPFVKINKLDSEIIYLDAPNFNEWIPKIDTTWSGALPATIIYNKNKKRFYEQSFTFEALEKQVKTFIN